MSKDSVDTAEDHGAPQNDVEPSQDSPQTPRDGDTQAADTSEDGADTSDGATFPPLTFRITPVSLLAVLAVAVGASPIAFSAPWALSIYLIPLSLTFWVLRTRTRIDTEHVVAQRMLARTRFGWDELHSFQLNERRWLLAVLNSGKRVRLPAVRVRDLPLLAARSGGRLPDPMAREA